MPKMDAAARGSIFEGTQEDTHCGEQALRYCWCTKRGPVLSINGAGFFRDPKGRGQVPCRQANITDSSGEGAFRPPARQGRLSQLWNFKHARRYDHPWSPASRIVRTLRAKSPAEYGLASTGNLSSLFVSSIFVGSIPVVSNIFSPGYEVTAA